MNQAGFYLLPLMPFIFIHMSLVNQPIVTAAKDDNSDGVSLIRRTCSVTEYPETCISFFESDIRSRSATNLTGLCSVGMNITYEKTNETLSYYVKAQANATDHWLKQHLAVCITDFQVGIFKMNKYGFPSFARGDYEKAGSEVGVCNYACSDCLDTGIQLYAKQTRSLFNFTVAVMDMLNLLQK